MIKTTICCDACGADLIERGRGTRYMMEVRFLSRLRAPDAEEAWGGHETPLLDDEPRHFCGWRCAGRWMTEKANARDVARGRDFERAAVKKFTAVRLDYVEGRGLVFTVPVPPVWPQIGETVNIDGAVLRVIGIEADDELLYLNVVAPHA